MHKSLEQLALRGERWAGEFVVIVLGILAALAVDSWSEDRYNRQLEREYLARIQDDLRWDLEEVEIAINVSLDQARAATSILIELNDPLAEAIPPFSDTIKATDFTTPVHEEGVYSKGHAVWDAVRSRSFDPRRGTYDELLATGRIIVIDDTKLRAAIIDHYSMVEDRVIGLPEAVAGAANEVDESVSKTGFNAFDFDAVDDPYPLLRGLDELPPLLRDLRRISLRQVRTLETVDKSSRELLKAIASYTEH
jgi:hypothetical protein